MLTLFLLFREAPLHRQARVEPLPGRTCIEMERRGRTLATARHDRLQRGQARDGRKAPQSVSMPADGTRRAMSSNGPTRSRIHIWQNVAPHRNIVRRPVVEHLTRLAWLERPDPGSARAALPVWSQ